jgi:hypothetical protein
MRLLLTCVLVAMAVMSSSLGAQKLSTRALADKVLTLGEVAEVTKVRGLRTVEKDLRTVASGDLNIADASGEVLLMLTVSPASEFALLKRTAAARVEGVGDEAYEAPNKEAAGGMAPYMLILRKGAYSAMLVSTFTATGAPRVPQAQLKQLGQIVASRLVPTASMPAAAAATPLDPKKAQTPLDPQKAVTLADVQALLGGKFAARIVEPENTKRQVARAWSKSRSWPSPLTDLSRESRRRQPDMANRSKTCRAWAISPSTVHSWSSPWWKGRTRPASGSGSRYACTTSRAPIARRSPSGLPLNSPGARQPDPDSRPASKKPS